jgi:SAM-dependent methyltransferase
VAETGYIPQAVVPRTARALELRGARAVVGDYARWGTGVLAGMPYSLRGNSGRFTFEGAEYPYLYRRHKFTWLTERAVEVPIAQARVDAMNGARILEVGNVLSHYRPQNHQIVDKYEQMPGVLNRDVLDLADLGLFDLIVAVSTLEHVGRDEEPRDPDKAIDAVRRLRFSLTPGGRLLLTVPVGYHTGLDDAIRTGLIPVTGLAALRRERIGPHWRQVPPETVWGTPYDFLLYSARAVVIAEIGPAVE